MRKIVLRFKYLTYKQKYKIYFVENWSSFNISVYRILSSTNFLLMTPQITNQMQFGTKNCSENQRFYTDPKLDNNKNKTKTHHYKNKTFIAPLRLLYKNNGRS